jgi:hypothetical protein
MSLPTNNKKGNGLPNKNQKGNNQNSKFITKPGGAKPVGVSKKPIKTGGSRGS